MGDEEKLNIRRVQNEIYFYEDVNPQSILELNILLREADGTPDGLPIILYIQSDGGDLFSGLSAMDHVESCKKPVHTVSDGMCCSAATFIFMGGTKRLVKKHSHMLIHQISSEGDWGRFEDMKDEMYNLQKLMDKVLGIYREYTNLPEKKLKRLMKKDVYLDAEQCIKYDIAHDYFSI